MTTREPSEALNDLLNAVVVSIVGDPDARPRPGQLALSMDILDAMVETGGQVAGCAPTGVGKALDVKTAIPTPEGWTTMGELEVGDRVFDENGQVCEVLGVSPVATGRVCYEVLFSTGESIVCDAEHLWATATRALRGQHSERRQSEASPSSIAVLERVEKLKAVRFAIELSPMHTAGEANLLLAGLADPATIASVRRGLGEVRLARGERFDLRPALDSIISTAAARSALHAPAPAPYAVLTSEEMRDTLTAGGARNHAVPVAGALNLPEATLLIDPWLLGAWLGDGGSNNGTITVGHDDIDAMRPIVEAAWRGRVNAWDRPNAWTVSCIQPEALLCPFGHDDWRQAATKANRLCRVCKAGGRIGDRWNTGLAEDLRRLGLKNNRHIPGVYLRASFDQRLALMQGLMDTDGTVNTTGRSEFCVSSERLARGFFELAASLGLRPMFRSGPSALTRTEDDGTKTRVDCGTRWRVGFSTQMPVFRLPRKAARLAACGGSNALKSTAYRYVTDVRPVASRLVKCIVVSSPSHLFLAGGAMIPTHNSIAYGAPAVLLAATRGDRTVISTESLALQSQLIDKDLPLIVAAARKLHGVAPKVAVLKGWSNFSCAKSAVATANLILGDPFTSSLVTEKAMDRLADRIDDMVTVDADETGPFAALLSGEGIMVDIDGREVALTEIAPVVSWTLRQHAPGAHTAPGDRHSYPGKTTEVTWGSVAVSPSECVGVNVCPFSDVCKPARAKTLAADADIVVTNHSMLATQAANDLAVVIGSKKLGKFDHVVIDEAHALPAQVRSQGAKEVSGRRILAITKGLRSVLDDKDNQTASLLADGSDIAEAVDMELTATMAKATGRDQVVKLVDGDDPVRGTGGMLESWLDRCANLLNGATKAARGDTELKVRRVKGRIDNLKADLRGVSDHRVGVARWVETDTRSLGRAWAAAHSSPVEIGGMLRGNLWTAPIPDDEEAPEETEDLATERITGKDGQPRYELSVIAVSATLPGGFAREMGMRAQAGEYPSPFATAYGASAFYVPRAVEPTDVSALSGPYSTSGRPKFNTKAHVQWCKPILTDLVEANGGSALVLAATADAGREYTEELRAHARGRWEVLSQWDGNALRHTTAAWRGDHHAVLVGTRSLMTGVDAPGDTCSLVVIDRIPRAPSNPVDDARVESLMKRLDIDKWAADRHVYSSDAALLLEQSFGRLIRSMTDSGMVACLDPRLLKVGPFKYQELTRQVYMKAAGRFDRKISTLPDAVDFLAGRRAGQVAA